MVIHRGASLLSRHDGGMLSMTHSGSNPVSTTFTDILSISSSLPCPNNKIIILERKYIYILQQFPKTFPFPQ